MTVFFEVISTSAPHIYRSALPLSPRTSIVRELYKPYARPLVRVVQGLPASWEPIVSAPEPHTSITAAAWSLCNGFITVARITPNIIEILDPVTLERLDTFESPSTVEWLSFSQNNHLLVGFSRTQELISWDLQTGGPVGTIHPESCAFTANHFSSTHSMDGKMVAAAYENPHTTSTVISTYNLSSGVHTDTSHVLGGRIAPSIWTHGEHVRFVTVELGSITMWEVGFTSIHTPEKIEVLPGPDKIALFGEFLFLPTLSRLAFTFREAVLVWDARRSRLLLISSNANRSTGVYFSSPGGRMSFSSDGHTFAYRAASQEIYLWQESPNGYTLQKVIPSSGGFVGPVLSRNGESIIIPDRLTIQLQHTADPLPPIPDIPTYLPGHRASFILEFSPDETLAAVTRVRKGMITVLDIKSGDLRLIIDTGMEVLGLRMTQNAIVVVAEGEIVTWNLPTEDRALSTPVNIKDSIWTTVLDYSPPKQRTILLTPHTSISPNLNYIAIAYDRSEDHAALNIYDVSTGKCLTGTRIEARTPWFTQDGCEVWCKPLDDGSVRGWRIVEDNESDLTKLEPLGSTAPPPGSPWQSPRGHRVTREWVLDSSGRRLLWLPRRWRSDGGSSMRWGGRFLGLLHADLLDAVILELGG